MSKKFWSILLVLVSTTAIFTGCSETEQPTSTVTSNDIQEIELSPEGYPIAEKQELVYNLGSDPLTIDPQLNAAIDGSQIINNIFDGLVREVDRKTVPAIAESWTISDDGLTYIFNIREDAKWSDGQPVTAHDFVFAWQRAADPKTASTYAYVMESANILNATAVTKGDLPPSELGVRAIDDKTFEVTLTNPTEYLLQLITAAAFMPVRSDIVDVNGTWAKNPETAISNGPFKLAKYTIGDEFILVKNENYWDAENVALEKITCKIIVDSSTAYTAYTTGQLDLLETIPAAEIPKLMVENPEFYVQPDIGTYFMIMNLNNEVFDDMNVRKALNYAIDRKTITELTAAGEVPATGFVGPGFFDEQGNEFQDGASDYNIPIQADIAAAQKFLSDAGYPDGEGFPEIEILYNTNETHKIVAEAIQEMWSENLGIDVTLINQEWAVFQEIRIHQQYDDIARHGWLGDYADPFAMLSIFETGHPHNNGPYSNPEFDEQLALSKTTIGQERMNHLYKAEEILMSDLPIIPVYYYVNVLLAADEIEGWELNSQGRFWFGDIVMLDIESN
ncbi:ABC transporter substrate-binding protein [Candidatus Epulonipiscioides gigas]|nr:ABC transporter substrate-binding protein [Epulopiscium sp. SCG-C07WGA-EpuloA2]